MAQRYWSRMGNRPPATDNATCQVCGTAFHARPSVLAKGKGKYCSRECFAAVQRTIRGEAHPLHGTTRTDGGPERPCLRCGQLFRHRRTKIKFCSRKCFHLWVAELNRTEGGNRQVMKTGYIRLTLPGGERVAEHRWVWEQAHGPIPPGAQIHHRNEIKTDNRLENLELVLDMAEHVAAHGGHIRKNYPAKRIAECHPDRPHQAFGLCQPCYQREWRKKRKGQTAARTM